jgi:hypothetical protein
MPDPDNGWANTQQLDLCDVLGLPQTTSPKLAERFGVPPFSVLNAREGWWQERKAAWIALGIRSELGRGGIAGAKLTMSDNINKLKPSADQALKRSQAANGKRYAATFGQDIMRGEHVVGGGKMNIHHAAPGGHALPAANYSKSKARDDGRGRAIPCGGTADGYEAGNDAQAEGSGTSIFDPVLTELAYRWFCPSGGQILDPFAGGSVRGIVASQLGYRYLGIELRQEQIDSNREQAALICTTGPMPEWVCGDARNLFDYVPTTVDFLLTCPPYGDLEVYSDDPRDLSTMPWRDFCKAHAQIIDLATRKMKPNRFAMWVVGDFRDDKGFYRRLPEMVTQHFADATEPIGKYNEAILMTAVGSLAVRVGGQFEATRKLGRTHQSILVFCKGDPAIATKRAKGG